MELINGIVVLPVRKKKYVLFFAGRKRGCETFDVLDPNGIQFCSSISKGQAIKQCQLHYIRTYSLPKRRSKAVHLVQMDQEQFDRDNSAIADKTNLRDFAEFSFDETEFNINHFTRNYL